MKRSKWKRRDLIRSLGFTAISTPLIGSPKVASSDNRMLMPAIQRTDFKPERPVEVIVLGAGGRGWLAYGSYGLKFPDELKVVGVADLLKGDRFKIAHERVTAIQDLRCNQID